MSSIHASTPEAAGRTGPLERLARLPAWLWPLALGAVVFQPGLLIVGPDASWYWVLGKNLANGLGYVGSEWMPEVRRGPGLPLLLAGSFRVFGEDISSAAWIVRVLFVASALVTYALGARWFGRAVGVVAAFGVLTNPVSGLIGRSITVDVAGVMFGMLAVLGLERGGRRASAGAALALAAAALTKEAALLVVLPLALHAALGRDRVRRLAELGAAVAFAMLVLAAWSLWAGGGALLADRVASFLHSGGPEGSFSIGNALAGLTQFAMGTAEATILWPAFVLGWLVVALCAARGSSPDRLLLLLGVSLVPVMVLQGLYHLRAGQSYLLFPLSFLAVARAVQVAAQHLAPRFRRHVLAATAALVVAIGFAEGDPSYWVDSWVRGCPGAQECRTANPLAMPPNPPEATGWLNPVVRDAAAWLQANTRPDETLISDWYWADALYLTSDGKRPIHRLPYVRSRDVSHMALETALPLPRVDAYAPLLFVFSQSNRTDPGHPDAWLNALSEPLLFARIEQVDADWLIVAKRRLMLADYFDVSPSFELAYVGLAELVRIYRIRRPLRPTPFDTGLEVQVGRYLDRLAASDRAAYDALVRDYFAAQLGVGAEEVGEWRDLLRASASRPESESPADFGSGLAED